MNRNYSFYLTVFASAWLLVIVGLILGYFYATSTLKVATFEYLPKEIQALYVKKDDVNKLSRYLAFEKSEIIPSNRPISSNVDELQSQVKSLREKNQALYQDNVNLADKNWKLANNLKNRNNQKDEKHDEHKRVKELMNEIASLQKKSIIQSKKYESIESNLKNEIEKLNIKLQKKELNANTITKASKKQMTQNPTLSEKNSFLSEQSKQLKAMLSEAYDKNAKLIEQKGKEIEKLKEKLSQKEININSLLSKHTSELIDMEQKNAIILRDLKQKIASLQIQSKKEISQKNIQIDKIKKQLSKSKSLIYEKQNSKENSQNDNAQVLILREKTKQLIRENEALEIKLEDMENKIRNIAFQKEKDYDEILKKVKHSLANSNEDVQRRTARLESRILEAANIIDNLKEQNDNLVKQLGKFDSKKLIPMEKFDKIEKKHARNYKIFNEVVMSLEKEKKSIANREKENMSKLEKSINKKMEELSKKYVEANSSVVSLNAKIKLLNSERKTLRAIESTKKEELNKKYTKASMELNITTEKLEKISKKFTLLQKENDKLALENSTLSKSLNLEKNELQNRNKKFLSEIEAQRVKLAKFEKDFQKIKEENIKLTNTNGQMLKSNHEKLSKLKSQYKQSQNSLLKATNELKNVKSKLKNIENHSTKSSRKIDGVLAKKDEKITLLSTRVRNVGETLKFTQDKLASLKDEKEGLQKDVSILNEEIQALKTNMENSQNVYNQTLSNLKQEKSELSEEIKENQNIIQNLKKEIKEEQTKHKTIANRLDVEIKSKQRDLNISKELIAKYNTALDDLRNRKAEIMALKNTLNTLKNTKKDPPSIGTIDEDKLLALQREIKKLKSENDSLKFVKQSKNETPKKPTKPKLLASIKCDDMPIGSNSPTLSCKSRVKEFLAKYNPNYFFEVIPIVDNSGFASLKKVSKSKIGIPIDEIKRLTRLSNIGLGKDRSKSGGEVIREVFGDLARVSYANSNEDIPEKRGFIIRVYE